MAKNPLLSARDIRVTYDGPAPVHALRGVSIEVFPGEMVAIEGPSGGGKSSLLNVLGLLQTPSGGSYVVDGADVAQLSGAERTRLRAVKFAFVFQSFHMLAGRPARDSVSLANRYTGLAPGEAEARANDALAKVGLAEFADQDASTLSGGQQQRVAIARALATGAPVLIADEPTGNLDTENSAHVMDQLCALRDSGVAVVLATHEEAVASRADRRIRVQDGKVVGAETKGGARRRAAKVTQPGGVGAAASVVPRRRRGSRGLLRDALASLAARRWRTAGLVGAVAVAVGLVVGTFGLGTTSSAQVSSEFDIRENRSVTIEQLLPGEAQEIATTGWVAPPQSEVLRQLRGIAGVTSVAILTDHDQRDVAGLPTREAQAVSVFSALGDLEEATDSTVAWSEGAASITGRRAVVGTHTAASLGLGPLDSLPTVWIDGNPYPVVGVLEESGRMPRLTGSVMVMGADDALLPSASRVVASFTVSSGAAPQVAEQAGIVLDPVNPELLRKTVPRDPRDLREQIESNVATSLAVLSLVAFAAAALALGNAMSLAVSSRRSEFGLRRAVGAAPRDVFSLVLTEAALVGVAGGAVGLLLGYLAVFAVTIAHRWTPVMEPLVVPLALVGGVVVGALAGVVAANQASRVDPAQALRM